MPDSFQVEKSAVPIHPEENDAKIMMDNNNYGALQNEPEAGKRPQQRFDILEPSYQRQSQCCHSNTDGFKVIVISMFVFAVGVTVALIITIASGKSRVLKKNNSKSRKKSHKLLNHHKSNHNSKQTTKLLKNG